MREYEERGGRRDWTAAFQRGVEEILRLKEKNIQNVLNHKKKGCRKKKNK